MRWCLCLLALSGCSLRFPDYDYGYYNGPWDRDGSPPDYSHHDSGPDDGGSEHQDSGDVNASDGGVHVIGDGGTSEPDAASADQCDAPAYSPSNTYAVGDEVTATCTAEVVGTPCYGHLNQRFGFRCTVDDCTTRAPGGDANGWWSAWESLGPCP